MKKYLFLLAACVFAGTSSRAQLTPQPSSTQTITQDFGLGKITLTYSRPNVKGRKIFGYTEPYNAVWRTGANSATTIRFTDEVMLEGHPVAAGTYGLFSIPSEKGDWTIILSKTSKQWGAYTYNAADDYLRFTIKPVKLKENVETFTMQFENVFPTAADLHLTWEHTSLSIHMTVDIDAKVMAKIDSAMQTAKKPYYAAVIYYYNNNKDMTKALAWAEELQKDKGFSPMVPRLWKARVQLRLGDKKGAAITAQEGIDAAKKDKSDEYIRLNTEVLTAAKK
ncbi:DUF2911 domain-containing protein [Mucilaginibacter sp. HMF5004]|uniref:DUF2911 domain-containing protein n=1 Tax=Mucilaginibacter rivuli TaxID=2857527 RepID=UPI001C5F4230|nr:DUF2911 domain-containing protein [Mucilaginibacter rivuli]MBW4889396.1 DUF2911 domain-containing protein [Mucilaginibacter rivuli]